MKSPFGNEWFDAAEGGAAEQFDKAQWHVIEDRARFFERLALLSAGAVVLSVSLLSTVFGRTTIHGILFLFAGWTGFIAALMASLFRELKYQRYLLESSMSNYLSKLADKKVFLRSHAATGQTVLDEPQEDGTVRRKTPNELQAEADDVRTEARKRKEDADHLLKGVRAFELTAMNGFWVGVLMLAVFAAVNITLGAGHRYFK